MKNGIILLNKSACLFSSATANISAIVGLDKDGCVAMPRDEEMLMSYLTSSLAAWRKSALPLQPCWAMFAVIGKIYMAAGQAGAHQ